MTKQEKDKILEYIAQEVISPLAFDERKASVVWEEMIGEPFHKLCCFVCSMVKE